MQGRGPPTQQSISERVTSLHTRVRYDTPHMELRGLALVRVGSFFISIAATPSFGPTIQPARFCQRRATNDHFQFSQDFQFSKASCERKRCSDGLGRDLV